MGKIEGIRIKNYGAFKEISVICPTSAKVSNAFTVSFKESCL